MSVLHMFVVRLLCVWTDKYLYLYVVQSRFGLDSLDFIDHW